MSSFYMWILVLVGNAVAEFQYPMVLHFDPDSEPGPDQECSQGVPRMNSAILPFPPGTPMNHPDIVHHVERRFECTWGNYVNNVDRISSETLMQHTDPDHNTEHCMQPANADERCFSEEEAVRRFNLIRNILDVTQMIVSVIDMSDYTIKIAANASCRLQVPIGNFTINHAFEDYYVETITFNADGTQRKIVHHTEDWLVDDLMDWASNVLSGHEDYLQLEYRMKHKDEFYQLDFKDTSTKFIILAVIMWMIFAPVVMVYFAMKCCTKVKEQKYSKVEFVSSGAEDMELMEPMQ